MPIILRCRLRRGAAFLILACLATVPRSQAQQPASTGSSGSPGIKRVEAMRSASVGGMRVDGKLDEPGWGDARFVSGFVQREPNEGAPASDSTSVAFVYDGEALYVGARMHSSDPGDIRALVTRRDREGSSEQLLISVDTFRDRRTAYTFAVTAAGVRIDYYHSADFENSRDYAFDPVWEARTSVDSAGWSAEMRIPFSQLRFNTSDEQIWGLNIVRLVPARNESAYWMLVRRNETGWSSRMGELAGIRGIRPSRRIELLPYIATDTRIASTVNASNPFDKKNRSEYRAGGDLKIGLGPNSTLEATFNPDFGQVEADPAEVNLSAYETFFAERRPFFTEGTQLLGGRGLFYSRRIGAAPQLRPAGNYSDVPRSSTILGAAKLSARLASKLSFAGLTAVTDREDARSFDATSNAFSTAEVAPRTFYGVGVVQQEFGRDASTVYAMLTAVERDIESGSLAERALARRAYTGLLDTRVRWGGGMYDVATWIGFSYVAGDSMAIAAQQGSSRRYYQRPDADYVEFDPGRTSLGGYYAGLTHSKVSGAHWLWDIDLLAESPGYEINDIGRLGGTDDIGAYGRLRYRETQRGRFFHNWSVGFVETTEWNFGGVRQFTNVALESSVTFKNFWRGYLGTGYNMPGLSDNLTRGGPLMGTQANNEVFGGLSSRSGARTGWSLNASRSRGRDGASGTNLNATITLRPGPQWELTLTPEYSGGVSARQYVASLPNGSPATFGRRYVFAYVERDEYSMRLRLNYALTPNLTLETYAEPFAASGRYYDYGELPAARRSDLRIYGTAGTTISEPDSLGNRRVTDGSAAFTLASNDFNVRSFRSNAVVRWEWRPGSTVFLVWQQDRFTQKRTGRAVTPGGMWDALTADGTQFLAVKVSYWLPVR